MHPILLQLGPITLRTYGALVVVAFLAALRVSRTGAPLRGIQEDFLLDLIAILILTGTHRRPGVLRSSQPLLFPGASV